MIRAAFYSVACLALGALAWALAAATLSSTGAELFDSGATLPLATGLAGLLVAAGLCPVSGSRRGVPALAALALPTAAFVLATLGRFLRTGELEGQVARAATEADPVALLAASTAGGAAETGAAFTVAGLAFLGAALVGASARADAYEPASPDPARWGWLGAGAASAGLVAATALVTLGSLPSSFRVEDQAVLASLAALLLGPAALLPLARKIHDLSPAPERRLAAARATSGLGLLGATASFAFAGRWPAAALALARLADTPPAERASALAALPEVVARYDAAAPLGLAAVGGGILVAALVLSRALRRPLAWAPPLVLIAAAVGAAFFLGRASRARVEALDPPPCEHDCLPEDLVLAFHAGAGLPHLAPSDRCDPPPPALPLGDTEALEPPRLEVGRCVEGAGVLVVVSTGEISVDGATALRLEAGRIGDEAAAAAALRDALGGARRAAPEGAPCRLLVHGRIDAAVVDTVARAAALAGFTSGRTLVAHPGRERPLAWRELPWPLPRPVEGGGWSAPARPVEGACAGLYRTDGASLVELPGDRPCGGPLTPSAEPWRLTFAEGELRLAGPWGETARAGNAADLATAARALLEGRLGRVLVRALAFERRDAVPFSRELEAQTALVMGPDAPFAAAILPGAEPPPDPPQATSFRVSFGGLGEDDASGLALTADGGVLVAGSFGLYADLDPGPAVDEARGRGSTNHYVMRLDGGGRRVWLAPLRGLGGGRAGAVDALDDGSLVLAGDFWGTLDLDPGEETLERSAEGERAAALVRLGPEGRLVWAHSLARIGGRINGRGAAIALDGSVYLTGSFAGRIDFDPGPSEAFLEDEGEGDLFVCRFDRDGALLWKRTVGGAGADGASGVVADADGGTVVVGQARGSVDLDPGPAEEPVSVGPFGDGLVLALDAEGNRRWARVLSASGAGGSASPSSVALSPVDGSVVVAGSFNGTVDFDPGEGTDAQSSAPGRGDSAFVACFDRDGRHLWARTFGGALGARVEAVTIASDGEILAAGRFAETADFDPGEGVDERPVAGDTDAFVTALGPDGAYRGTLTLGGPRVDGAGVAVRAPDGSVVVAGRFGRVLDLDPGEGVDERTSAGETDAFVIRIPGEAIGRTP